MSFDNLGGKITRSDLEQAALVLYEATFPVICSNSAWKAPLTCSNNTPTVVWSFKEASTTNPVVVNLLYIRAITNTAAIFSSTVFYHPCLLNTMADDASSCFDLAPQIFISFFFYKYQPI